MSDDTVPSVISSALPPPAVGPVTNPAPKPQHDWYVWHDALSITLTTGTKVSRGGTKPGTVGHFGGADALAFEIMCAKGEAKHKWATPVPKDPGR